MTAALVLACLAVCTTANANEQTSWNTLHDALLSEAADGELSSAVSVYQQLVRNLPPSDPTRAEAMYWLGRGRYLLGDTAGAVDALREGVRTGACGARCHDLLARIQLDEDSVRTVPTLWQFDTPKHGVAHPWNYDERGAIRIQKVAGRTDRALVWSTTPSTRQLDRLVVGYDQPQPTPEGVRFSIESREPNARIRLIVEDDRGREYSPETGSILVPVDRAEIVEIRLNALTPVDDTSGPFDPATISRMIILDTSALYGGTAGPNELYIDDFETY